ncbi:MAG: hypothetical protein J5732_09070 [Bacteroidaceae bacterium]|nr:hypothetical protein [Bacteroidaceae bacterium]
MESVEQIRQDRIIRNLDRAVFFVFAFCYLLFLQVDLEWQVHNILTDKAIPFHPFLLALMFSFLVTVIEIPFSKLLGFRGGWRACNYVPSAILLGAATSHNDRYFVGYSWITWTVILVSAVILLLFLRFLMELNRNPKISLLKSLSINLGLLSLFLLIPPLLGNTGRITHEELRAERIRDKNNPTDMPGEDASLTEDSIFTTD